MLWRHDRWCFCCLPIYLNRIVFAILLAPEPEFKSNVGLLKSYFSIRLPVDANTTYGSQHHFDNVLNPIVLLTEIPKVSVFQLEVCKLHVGEVGYYLAKHFAFWA
jgi:hypothetical protein